MVASVPFRRAFFYPTAHPLLFLLLHQVLLEGHVLFHFVQLLRMLSMCLLLQTLQREVQVQ